MAVETVKEEDGARTAPPGFDWRAAGEGALWTLAVALPPVALVLALKSGDLVGEESNLWLLTPVALLVGFGVGGFAAGRRRPDMPLLHAAAAGALAFGSVVVVAVARRLVDAGDEVTGGYFVRLLLLAQICVSCSLLGGYLAVRRALGR